MRLILTVIVAFALVAPIHAREWTDATGNYSIQAEFVKTVAGSVQLRKADGSIVTVPLNRLSAADQQFLHSESRAAEPAALTLVRNGEATSVIVTNGRPKEAQSLAAAELQEHIHLISGATLPIVQEQNLPADESRALILVGQGDRVGQLGVNTKTMEPESIVIKTVGNALILAGEDGGGGSNVRTGTLWAVYDFLQDQLGVRWLWPGEIGRVAPEMTTIHVPHLDLQETPVVKVRGFRMTCQEKHRIAYEQEGLGKWLDLGDVYEQLALDERTWLRRMRMGRSFKLSYGHAFTDWWEKYGESDPDLFALQPNGHRGPRRKDRPDFVKMCISNPKLWDLQLASLRKYAQQGARGLWINACENDGSGGFCTCQRCRAWDADPNTDLAGTPTVEDGSDVDAVPGEATLPENLSDRYARWYNELAVRAREADPEARIIAYAYSNYRSPPTKIDRIEPNVWIGYVGFNAYPRPAEYRKLSVDEWFGWSRLGATVFLRSNSLFYCGEGAPYIVSHQIAEDTKFQITNGLRATDFDCLQGYWATTGPSYYVLARMLWDAEADPDALLDEFYGGFGPMKPIVQEYFDYWEEFTTRLGDNPEFFELRRPDRMAAYGKFYNDAVLSEADAILSKAESLLPTATDAERERFRNIRLGLEHGRLLAAALDDGKTSTGDPGRRLLEFRREIAPRNVVNVYWTTSKEKRYRVFD